MLGCVTERAASDVQTEGVKEGKSLNKKDSGGLEIIDTGPGPLGEVRKGQWTRKLNRPNPDSREDFMQGAKGLKRKVSELQGSEESSAEKEKRQKIEEETKKLSVLLATHLRSAEVVKQPRRGQ